MYHYNNPVLEKLPRHLKQYIVDQRYERYTPVDHAVWRYVMRQNYSYLKNVAYYPYIPGLKKAGLTIERIPDLQNMNDHLKQIGWGAVTVDGFIPPVAFMEFQAHRVLVIAADIRQIDHIEYTPAPDIIHESSGHAPIIAEPEYAEYLRYFGEVGSKAMFSFKDFQFYEAIRHLSILKEKPDADPVKIKEAEKDLEDIQQNMGQPSEMALLSRLHWWTVEYGLIGSTEDPKIYGAGLLSSIGESVTCMQSGVKKLPYTIDAVNYPYDITQPQPQLFVTPDFQNLMDVLEQFADSMSFRRGGLESILKAVECKNVCTTVYSSGLQVSGVFQDVDVYGLVYIQTAGPTALAYEGKELQGHGKDVHIQGFGSPVGKLRDYSIPLEDFSRGDLKNIGIEVNKPGKLAFESGILVEGTPVNIEQRNGKIILISFRDCRVRDGESEHVFFEPSQGIYDMAVGHAIVSVFCGAADKDAYEQVALVAKEQTFRTQYDEATTRLHQLYQQVRDVREGRLKADVLPGIWKTLATQHPKDWLCALEILEIAEHRGLGIATEIKSYLAHKKESEKHLTKLIGDGLRVMDNPDVNVVN